MHQQASFAQSTTTRTTPLFPLQVTLPSLLQNNTTLPLTSTTGEPGPSRRLFQMTSSQGSTETIDAMEQGGLDSSQDSEGSWVAEDDTTGNVQSQESGESSTSTLSRPMQLSTPLSRLPISGSLEYEIGEGKLGIAPESTVVVSTSSSLVHTVERIANPALLNAKSLPVRTSNFSNRKVTSSSNLDQRLHSAYPLITSTPQLSPVHEERSQNVSVKSLQLSRYEHVLCMCTCTSDCFYTGTYMHIRITHVLTCNLLGITFCDYYNLYLQVHVDERPDPNLTQLQSQVSVSNSSDRQSFNKSHSKTPMPGSISTLSSIIRTPSSSKYVCLILSQNRVQDLCVFEHVFVQKNTCFWFDMVATTIHVECIQVLLVSLSLQALHGRIYKAQSVSLSILFWKDFVWWCCISTVNEDKETAN